MSEHTGGPEASPHDGQDQRLIDELHGRANRMNERFDVVVSNDPDRPYALPRLQPGEIPTNERRERIQAALNALDRADEVHELATKAGLPRAVFRAAADMVDPEGSHERRTMLRDTQVDPLTQIANRAAFERAREAADTDPSVHVLMFDGDHFGLVNKKVGNDAGDAVILAAARAIDLAAEEAGLSERVFRLGPTHHLTRDERRQTLEAEQRQPTYRVGGDEFVVLGSQDLLEAVQARAAELFAEQLSQPEIIDSTGTPHATQQLRRLQLDLSSEIATNFADADRAMQAAKERRKRHERSWHQRARRLATDMTDRFRTT